MENKIKFSLTKKKIKLNQKKSSDNTSKKKLC